MNEPEALQVRHQRVLEAIGPAGRDGVRLFATCRANVSGTMQFPERCNLKLHAVDNPFPAFPVPEGETLDSYFEQVCRKGLQKRLATSIEHLRATGLLKKTIPDYQARLDREIECIKQMKFPGYFMIVWDFIRYAREQAIPVGPGRGSAAGSLVAYCMEITDVDPLQNELLFESASSILERVNMPDIDIDFCMNRRGEVIDYVKSKYGDDQVAQIITFNTMAAKAAIKDVGRALDMPYGEVDRIAKLIPATIGITIQQALKESPPLATAYDDPKVRELIDTAMRLEGLVRGAGVHAAGVVIAPKPLTELVPVTRTKDEAIVTSYDMKSIEKMGLLKMDFLGLTTLTVIHDALNLIKSTKGIDLDLSTIALDDVPTYEQVFHRALTSGVFQFESSGMRDVLRRYKPNRVEDLTALNALYRPGPMSMIDDFIERKWGRRAVEYDLPEMETILRETFGVMVYQEQVMQISNAIAGYSLGEADLLRRAMGKKDVKEMAKQRERFMSGAAANKHPKDIAGKIFDLMALFAGYGFNKSHSAAYALLAYHTAWLKTHYPARASCCRACYDQRNLEAGKCRQVHRRVPRDEHPRGAAQRAGVGRELHAGAHRGRRGDRLWAGRHQECRAQCHRLHPAGARDAARGRGAGFRQLVGVLRQSRSAPAEQARAGVADQGRRDGWLRHTWPG